MSTSGQSPQSGSTGRHTLFAISMSARWADRASVPPPMSRATASRPSVRRFLRSTPSPVNSCGDAEDPLGHEHRFLGVLVRGAPPEPPDRPRIPGPRGPGSATSAEWISPGSAARARAASRSRAARSVRPCPDRRRGAGTRLGECRMGPATSSEPATWSRCATVSPGPAASRRSEPATGCPPSATAPSRSRYAANHSASAAATSRLAGRADSRLPSDAMTASPSRRPRRRRHGVADLPERGRRAARRTGSRSGNVCSRAASRTVRVRSW